jgi:hypothetical protein
MMRGRAVRRVPERSMEVEPVVSYSLIPPDDAGDALPDDGRVEPRLSVPSLERTPRFEEIAAPSASEVAEHAYARFEAQPIDALPPDPRDKRRRGVPRVAIIGLIALLVGFGVLAVTFGRVVTGGANVTQAPAVETPAVALAPPPPATDDTAGPGVRVIPGTEAQPMAAQSEPATGEVAAPANITTVAKSGTEAPAAEPPKPRLRPTAAETDIAVLPKQAQPAPVARPTPIVAPQATAPAGDDVNALMANVDKLLAEHKATAGDAATTEPLADNGIGLLGGAAPALRTASAQPPALTIRRGVPLFPDDQAIPVPPADIPNPEGATGQ